MQGTTQNDLVKEYLSRGTYVFPPRPSMALTTDIVVFTARELPKWNPTNVCSYHLQEAGASPVQELSFALATAIALLDSIRARPEVSAAEFPELVGRISFFVNAGMRFVTELCKMRAFVDLWDEITLGRYGVADEQMRRFRYGVQVNSLGLTEPQPENNVYRILIEMLAVTLSKKARARAVQLPAWNEALGLPRPFDQQWSLRMQQVLAYETDLLEFGDIFDGSTVIDAKVAELKAAALAELAKIDAMGGALAAIETGYMKQALVENGARRIEAIERGEQIVIGVNKFTNSEPSPLSAGEGNVVTVPDSVEIEAIARLKAWRSPRDGKAAEAALAELASAAKEARNVMPASIACAKAGVTTGEWAQTLREIFGEYRAPTGVDTGKLGDDAGLATVKAAVARATAEARPAAALPRRQARSRRPLERRRADRGARPRRRHGRELWRHPPDARRDRGPGAGDAGRHHRPVDPLGLASAAGARRHRAAAGGGHERAGRGRRHHPARRRERPAQHGRGAPSTRRRISRSTASSPMSRGWRRRSGTDARATRHRPQAMPDAFELLIGLQDFLQGALARAVAAIGVGVEALHQLLVAGLDRDRVGILVEPQRLQRLARDDADPRLRLGGLLGPAGAEDVEGVLDIRRFLAAGDAAALRHPRGLAS